MNTRTEEQRNARVSVVIPVFNGGSDLERCLAAVHASTCPVFECILVDDASTDGMVKPVAERHGARVIRLDSQIGPAQARNLGAEAARGEILFFTDADVLLHADALSKAVEALQSDNGVTAVFGSYDDQPGHAAFISQYRNLFHHWVHQTGGAEASTFWTGCGAIWRSVFLELDGFSSGYRRPSIEDIEFGTRLRRSGHRIRLLKSMFGTHTKKWTLRNMVRTDIFQRGVPWMLLMLRDGQVTSDLNLSYKSRLATLLAGFFGMALLLLPLTGHAQALLPVLIFLLVAAAGARLKRPPVKAAGRMLFMLSGLLPLAAYMLAPDPLALLPLLLVLSIALTHLDFYIYCARKRGFAFAMAVLPMQVLFFIGCAVSIPFALVLHLFGGGPDLVGRADPATRAAKR